jgi:LDH2 family malate/lactate/ureidoglycolate dehydrogenase
VSGAAVVGVRRSNHFGEGSYYVAQAIAAGMIGLITTGGSPNMPYWGGREPVLGTLPLAVGVPAGQEAPIVLDLAFGTVSKGKVIQAAARGERIPLDWAVDRDGNATDDPHAVLDGGWVLPIGTYKGSGLILIMEILSAVLTGARFATDVYELYGDHGRPQGLGHFVFVIDVAAFMPLRELTDRVDRLIRIVKASGPAGELLMPGEREQRLAEQRQTSGVPLPADTIKALGEIAGDVGFPITTEGSEFLAIT